MDPGVPSGEDRPPPPREVEGTLLVRSEEPEEVRERLADLSTAGPYRLLARPEQRIRDTYLDLPDGTLRAHRIALRLRALDDALYLTVKADSRATEFVADRLEIEERWSEGTLARILDELQRRGISRPEIPADLAARDPLDVLRPMGFGTLQSRETDRLPRDVVPPGGSQTVAELAIDRVRYGIDGREVRLHEVEVETRGSGDADRVLEVTSALREPFPQLHPWRHGKLATGLALRDLLEAGRLDGLLREDGTLTLPGYEVLASWCEIQAS